MEYKKSKTIEDTNYVCSTCDDEPEYCYECEESLEDDKHYYCDGFGEHLCPQCYNKIKKKKKNRG